MRVIIAGSRHIEQPRLVIRAFSEFLALNKLDIDDITEIVCGMARGVDLLGKQLAEAYSIECKRFPAEWEKYGKGAGPKRNVEMARNADALVLVWDGESTGSKHMLDTALMYRLKVYGTIHSDGGKPEQGKLKL